MPWVGIFLTHGINLYLIINERRANMNNETKILSNMKKHIQEFIKNGEEDILHWENGQNLIAENIANSIYARNEKLKKLLMVEPITKNIIEELINAETDDSLVLIYEDIIDLYEYELEDK